MTDETKQKVRELVDSLVAEASAVAAADRSRDVGMIAIAVAIDDLDLTMRRILSELRKIAEAADR